MEDRVKPDHWVGSVPARAFVDLSGEDVAVLETHPSGSVSTLAVVEKLASRVLTELRSGAGLAILRGFPVGCWGYEKSSAVYAAIGAALGCLREQSPSGNLLHDVTDLTVLGVPAEEAGGSNSRKRISLHTENARPPRPPRVLGLLSIRTATAGGESLLFDGNAIFCRLVERRPDLLAFAQGQFAFGRHDYDRTENNIVDAAPIFWENENGLAFRYSRYWLEKGARDLGLPVNGDAVELFDAIDELLEDESLCASLLLEPGSAIFINNERVMHGREAFEDRGAIAERRCLVRMWVDYL